MAATLQWQHATSTGPTMGSIEGGATFGREDAVNATAGTPVPTATGTAYSYQKTTGLVVTGTDATTISARQVKLASSPGTGLLVFFKNGGTSYSQSVAALAADAGSNGAVPATWTALTASYQSWDAGSDSAGSTGLSGDYLLLGAGVDNLYVSGGGSASLPTATVQYQEE